MPVNTAALKTFAPAMRRQLLEAVGRKLDLLLNSQTPDTISTYAKQIAELRELEAENREQLLERVAYTWFNRLCALRYLDAREWHPFGGKVLMPAAEGETQPELLKLVRAGNLPAGLQSFCEESRLHGLMDGKIQSAIAGADPQGEVYRELVLAACRFYHELLPNVFEALDDATELLLPDDLIADGSIAGKFRKEISDDDCEDVEILGWLYQFYISEKKDEVMARKKAVPANDIPAVTQLFTPHWIVRYLVENSLGRLWMLNRPGSNLRKHMPFYIEGKAETEHLVIHRPEEIRLLDPACGSGHMLTYAFDLLTLIYEEEGYSPNDIPGLILLNNLHGLDICPRATQLAELALVFKAREKSRRFFQAEQLIGPQITEIKDLHFDADEINHYVEALCLDEHCGSHLIALAHRFGEAKNLGALIQTPLDEGTIGALRHTIEAKELGTRLILRTTQQKVLCALKQAEALTQQYHLIVANPPYMGGSINSSLAAFLAEQFRTSRGDLSATFIFRALQLCVPNGYCALVTMHSWMFLSSLAEARSHLLSRSTVITLAHHGIGAFPSLNSKVVQTAAVVLRASIPRSDHYPVCDRVLDYDPQTKIQQLISGSHRYSRLRQADFFDIDGCPFAYWLSDNIVRSFRALRPVGDSTDLRSGMATGNNNLFLRFWHEIEQTKMGLGFQSRDAARLSGKCWFPYNKGGNYRKWYGNNQYVVLFENDGEAIKKAKAENLAAGLITPNNSKCWNQDRYFQTCLTWSALSSSSFSLRYCGNGFIFDTKGQCLFAKETTELRLYLLLLNSTVSAVLLEALAPTLDFNSGSLARIPDCTDLFAHRQDMLAIADECISLARTDWDNYETSWDFSEHPLVRPGTKGINLKDSWGNWKANASAAIQRMQELETLNNRLFIDAYGLDGELNPDVPEDQITLAYADIGYDIRAFISYAIGCMMGRYSLEKPGLILADALQSQAEQLAAYERKAEVSLGTALFTPDPDGIIPILDGEWFEDDIVARAREFLSVTLPESSVAENLRFIEESLGKDIRKYFCSDFYKDHLQTYKKRPIYWMVQSPKKGFACLIYLHRYTKDTLNQVLNNYLRPYLQKLEARLAQRGLDQLNDDLPGRERTAARKEVEKITRVLKECQAWEQDALLPLAQQRIELVLNDGVKENYLKLQDVLAPIPGLAAKDE